MSPVTKRTLGAPVPERIRERVSALVGEHGESSAARLIGCSRGALLRSLAGLRVYPGTLLMLELALIRLEQEPRL